MARSVCPLDCPDTCSLEVSLDEATGRVTKVDGTRENPLTQGFICAKVRGLPSWYYGPKRVELPLMRNAAGTLEPVSWDAALDRVARELARVRDAFGGEAILPLSYGGSNGSLSQDTTDLRFFSRLGARRLARTVCAAATGAASKGLYGSFPGTALEDYQEAQVIVVWGANPHATGIHVLPYIAEAQKRGARLMVVDPRVTKLAGKADLHLAPRVGTDLPLALGIMHVLREAGAWDETFLAEHARGRERLERRVDEWPAERAAEVCDLPADRIREFAAVYAGGRPAVIRCGWGLERNRNGASAVAAVLALPAVAGKFGVRGGGFTLSNSAAWRFNAARAVAAGPWETRELNMNKVGAALTGSHGDPIHAVFVYNCNPVATLPHQSAVRRGFERKDLFTVVFDSYRTDTAELADVVLPATGFLERREVRRGYGTVLLQDARPVIEPVGESRTNHAVFLELCDRMGLTRNGDARSEDEVLSALLNTVASGSEVSRALRETGRAEPPGGMKPVQFKDAFPELPEKKIDLFPEALDREAPAGLYGYQESGPLDAFPLQLISPATGKTISSSLGHAWKDTVPVVMHPRDAEARELSAGQIVRVFNDLGDVVTLLEVSERLRPGVAELPKGLWSHNTLNGATATILAPDTLSDCGGNACFNDARVEVEAVRE